MPSQLHPDFELTIFFQLSASIKAKNIKIREGQSKEEGKEASCS